VGVQGDSRSYAPVLAIPDANCAQATELINRIAGINRVVACIQARAPLAELQVLASALTPARLERLRQADAVVRRLSESSGFERTIWQFPVVLIPLGTPSAPDSIVLRPVHSVDGMTAQAVTIPEPLLQELTAALLEIGGVGGVFCDLTNKPPATIEWE
jgi:GMP synthase (glutamine-hydrolysing)